jgi:Histidinol-phosphate/aromatic aminotransferase and cobyric acid decarboxylase
MSRFLSKRYKSILPYVPGEQPQEGRFVKLNTNENPYPPSDKTLKKIGVDELKRLKLYSDPEAKKSTSAVAAYYGVGTDNVLMTNGSDEALAFCYAAFCDAEREVVSPEISYGFYPVFCELFLLKYHFIPLDSNYKVDVPKFCGINKNIVIANPNAPTGIALTLMEN